MENLFIVKPVELTSQETGEGSEHGLKRVLGPLNLMAMGVGLVIGAGIFVVTGSAAAQCAGPALVLSFLLASIACCFAGLCYSEFSSLIPVSGSAYGYSYVTLGEFTAWVVGWTLALEYSFGAATVASGWGSYFVSLIGDWGIHIHPKLLAATGTTMVYYENVWSPLQSIAQTLQQQGIDPASLPQVTALINIVPVVCVLLLTGVLIWGIQESARLNNIVVVLKIAIVMLFLVVGGYYIFGHWAQAIDNWTPFIPENLGKFGEFGWSGVARGAGVIFFAYVGFDSVSTLAQEARNPQRDMPIGILGTLVISTLLYMAVTLVLTGIIPYTQLNVADPVARGIDATGVSWGILVVKLGAVLGLLSGILLLMLGQSRILLSMANDGLLPEFLGRIHPTFRTPVNATIFVGLFVAFFAGLVPISRLGELVSIGTLIAFIIVCVGVIVLRRTKPELPRPFRCPWVPVLPILGVIFPLVLMLSLPLITWVFTIIWQLIGLAIYFTYGYKHSYVRNMEKEKFVPTAHPPVPPVEPQPLLPHSQED